MSVKRPDADFGVVVNVPVGVEGLKPIPNTKANAHAIVTAVNLAPKLLRVAKTAEAYVHGRGSQENLLDALAALHTDDREKE